MATEFEIKLRAGNVRQLEKILKDPQVAGHALEKLREIHMKTTYYDTADGALSSRKWMLRVRQENERSVVTMKTPGVGYARGEWECEGDSPEAAIETLIGRGAPEELRELSAPGLQMVCGATFIRLTQPLRLSGKTTCEICADGGELLGGKRSASWSWSFRAGAKTSFWRFPGRWLRNISSQKSKKANLSAPDGWRMENNMI